VNGSRNDFSSLAPWAVRSAALLGVALSACTSTPAPTNQPRNDPAPAPSPAQPDQARIARDRLELASLYFSRGQMEAALDDVRRALEAKPDLAEGHGLLGLIYGSQGEAEKAEASFRRALQLTPRDGDLMHNYGWFLCQQRRYDDANVQFDAALAQPQYRGATRTWLAQGVCFGRAGRWLDAERALLHSYELDPSNPLTAYNLSDVLLRRGELERARFYVRRINSQAELSSAQSLWLAARIEKRRGDSASMEDFGRQLRERFPQSSEALQYERGSFDE
jgi:type IV pilus assembly protein PilF